MEIAEEINSMKLNTAPVPEAFMVEFYKKFSETLQLILVSLFQACVDNQRLPETWSDAKLTLLSKPGKDPKLLKSYRPILLLNCN